MSTDIEQVLIARLLVEPEQIAGLAGSLDASDFQHPASARTWAAMQRLVSEGRPIDIAVLRAEGADPGEPTRVLTSAHTAPVEEYARRIREASFKRHAEQEMDVLHGRIGRLDEPADITRAIHEFVAKVVGRAPTANKWASIVDISLADFEKGGMPYGFPSLDAMCPPAYAGNLITVAARPNVGKSAFALNVAESWARRSKFPVLFVSVEMSAEEVKKRHLKHIPAADLPLYKNLILTDKARTTAAIRQAASELRLMFGGVSGILVDYIQKVADPGEIQHERVARISGTLKDIAVEFECPVLAPSQLSRQADGERKPKLSDLAQSGAIEADSDVVFALWRPSKSVPWVEVLCLKHRHARADWSLKLDFDLETVAVRGE